ncbi:MAG: hypothetical protein SGARI_000453 [Bacillariaceae sp.]
MDFDTLTQQTGLQVMDLDEFMRHQHHRGSEYAKRLFPSSYFDNYNSSIHSWCNGNIERETKLTKGPDNKPQCEVGPALPYGDLHSTSYKVSGKEYVRDCRVANIGSGFILRNKFTDPEGAVGTFDEFFDNYPLVQPWNQILKTILGDIPNQKFLGVHVRTQDGENNCQKSYLLYHGVADELLDILSNRTGNNSNNDNDKPVMVVIGRATRTSKECMVDALRKEMNARNSTLPMPRVVTVNDLIVANQNHTQIKTWLGSIAMEESTVNLLLDQFVLALAKDLLMKVVGVYKKGSTFQQLIRKRHAYRDKNLAELGFSMG